MIRLDDDYFIDVDSCNYTLKRDLHKVYTEKSGTERNASEVIGYYSTLYKALLGAREYFIRECLSKDEIGLSEVANLVSKANKKYEDMLYGALELKGKK